MSPHVHGFHRGIWASFLMKLFRNVQEQCPIHLNVVYKYIMHGISSLSLLSGEALMSLYPILVKSVKTDLLTHMLVRLVTAVIICYPFITLTTGHIMGQLSYHIISILYVFHIYSSYVGFLNLDVGVALTLFYTYPLINVLIKECFVDRHINWTVIGYFLISFIGVLLITKNEHETSHLNWKLGVGAMILSALTESLIYTFYKTNMDTNPFNMLFIMCFTGVVILSLIYFYKKYTPTNDSDVKCDDERSNIIIKLILANAFLGVGGYLLRFYSLPNITTEWFSILSFSGVIFGYLYGWSFFGESINLHKVIGTILIMLSVYQVRGIPSS